MTDTSAAIPIAIPSAVNTVRPGRERMPVIPSRGTSPNRSVIGRDSVRSGLDRLDRVLDPAVADVDHTRHRRRDLTIVGDHDDRRTVGVEHPEQVDDLGPGDACRDSRWARRPAASPARVTGALAIAARWRSPPDSRLGRCVAVAQSNPLQAATARAGTGRTSSTGRATAKQHCREHSSFRRGGTVGTRIRSSRPRIADKLDRPASTRLDPTQHHRSRCCSVEAPEHLQQRALPDPDGPTIAKFSDLDAQVHPAQGLDAAHRRSCTRRQARRRSRCLHDRVALGESPVISTIPSPNAPGSTATSCVGTDTRSTA